MTIAARGSVYPLRLGTIGYSVCLISALALAMLAPGWRVVMACGVSLVLAAAFYRAGLEPLRRVWLWMLIAVLVGSSALLDDRANWTILGVSISREGFTAGVQMSLRAVAIAVAVTGFAASVSISETAGLLERAGLRGLGFALGVAVNILPIVQDTAATTYHALRLRGGFRRERLRAVRLLLITIVVNSLRHADDIVSAAEARAFSPARARPLPIVFQARDLVLAIGLAVVFMLVLWG